jgi:hypothetical protein
MGQELLLKDFISSEDLFTCSVDVRCIVVKLFLFSTRLFSSPPYGDSERGIFFPCGGSMHIFRSISILAILLVLSLPCNAQKRFGAGVSVGESVSIGLVPIPMYGGYGLFVITPSIHAGLQVGFVTGTSSGDSKTFDNLTAIEIAPYGKILFGGVKDLRPFFKLSVAFINYNVKMPGSGGKDGSSTDESNSSLWGAMGVCYDISQKLSVMGEMRFFDIGMTGKSKISYFGLGSPALALEMYF